MSTDFSEQGLYSRSSGNAYCIACLVAVEAVIVILPPTCFSEAKCSSSLNTPEGFAGFFYNVLDPRSNITKTVFRTHLKKLRCRRIASFYRLGNRDTRLMPCSEVLCHDKDTNIFISSAFSSMPLNFSLRNTSLWTGTERASADIHSGNLNLQV